MSGADTKPLASYMSITWLTTVTGNTWMKMRTQIISKDFGVF